jgi:hypothetical protein
MKKKSRKPSSSSAAALADVFAKMAEAPPTAIPQWEPSESERTRMDYYRKHGTGLLIPADWKPGGR